MTTWSLIHIHIWKGSVLLPLFLAVHVICSVAVFRLRTQHRHLCQALQNEEELEGHINTKLKQQEWVQEKNGLTVCSCSERNYSCVKHVYSSHALPQAVFTLEALMCFLSCLCPSVWSWLLRLELSEVEVEVGRVSALRQEVEEEAQVFHVFKAQKAATRLRQERRASKNMHLKIKHLKE